MSAIPIGTGASLDDVIAALQTWSVANGGGFVQTGMILGWTLGTPPSGYLLTDGSAVSRGTYAALFAVLGVSEGAGNGTTTFTLPTVTDSIIKT